MEKFNDIIDKIKEFFEKINDTSLMRKTPSKAFIITAFTFIVVAIGIFSAVTVINENKENKNKSGETSVTAETTFVSENNTDELLGNFLLVLTQDGNKKIELLSLVRLDSLNRKVKVSFIKPHEQVNVNGFTGSMQEHLEHGGVSELVWAMGEYASISIERYIIGDEQNFIDFMKSLGTVEIVTDEKINYTHRGIPIVIEEGVQNLSADMMLKYFVYLSVNYETVPDKLTETMVIYGKKMFDSSDDNVLDESFGKMIKHFSTDISVVDFTKYKKAVKTLASSENIVEITIETDPSQLK